jgi:transketolase
MAAICNGLDAYGGFLPFCATFANFIGYAWGAARLSALSQHKVLYIATHDSIDLGEDGPTHQPIEILALLRGTPCMQTIRPADAHETLGAYMVHFAHKLPTVIMLSRGNVANLSGKSSAALVAKGAYVLSDFEKEGDISSGLKKKIVLAATGTEVGLLLEAKSKLILEAKLNCRVVSFPSFDLFDAQPEQYRQSVFPQDVKVLFVEASSCIGAEKYADAVIGMKSFGASAPAKALRAHFGFTVENVCDKAEKLIE